MRRLRITAVIDHATTYLFSSSVSALMWRFIKFVVGLPLLQSKFFWPPSSYYVSSYIGTSNALHIMVFADSPQARTSYPCLRCIDLVKVNYAFEGRERLVYSTCHSPLECWHPMGSLLPLSLIGWIFQQYQWLNHLWWVAASNVKSLHVIITIPVMSYLYKHWGPKWPRSNCKCVHSLL